MYSRRAHIVLFIGILFAFACKSRKIPEISQLKPFSSSMEHDFKLAPDSIQTSIYWYWMSDNISKEGVVKDLQAMKRVGINRAFIGNIGYPSTPYGKVKLLSDEWWDILHTALKTATELNIEIGIFNSPGWSQSGGPWIKPEQSMRYLTSSELRIKGGRLISAFLKKPTAEFQDVRVIAYKTPKDDQLTLSGLKVKLQTSSPLINSAAITDGNRLSETAVPAKKPFTIDFISAKRFTARSVVIYPAHHEAKADVLLQVKVDSGYRTLKSFVVDRSNSNLNVGFDPYGPVAISIPAVESKQFRLIFSNATDNFGLAEIEISASPVVERFTEKTLAKMYQTPLPYWSEYQWAVQPVVDDQDVLIDPKSVVDISKFLSADGQLKWAAPIGDWTIMRMGMAPTEVQNSPASPEGTGLEVDKMSKEHVAFHFDSFLGEIIKRIPAADRKTWKVTVEDSYETGGQNWTDGLIEKFKLAFGYDPLPFLPVMKGKVVGSQMMSDRFLWDLRRFIADRVAYDYVAGLREISHKHGLHTWLENYGHWGFPGEFLQYGGQSDEVGGEFWSEGDLGNIENRAASSAAHIYGKTKVSAESFTAGYNSYGRYPAMMKQRGDRFFTEGINNTLLHVFIEQPDERLPGMNAGFGNEFNRHNTWFDDMDLFTAYLKRCNFMLQQGKYVADVAYFIGEDAPKMTGVTDPALPQGYSFDYINGEVIKDRLQVKDGRLVLPDGMSYGILVLPKLETMRPELLRKIAALVNAGATVLGPAPLRSPSLQYYPAADNEVKQLAADLWTKEKVLTGTDLKEALNHIQIPPDFTVSPKDSVLFIHRRTDAEDIYFVSNQSQTMLNLSPEFRVMDKIPELWDPVSGTTRLLPQYTKNKASINVPLTLSPLQSVFVVFRKSSEKKALALTNFPEHKELLEITTPWRVTFDPRMRGPEKPVTFEKLESWTERSEEDIKYYSGTAVYRNSFQLAKPADGAHTFLNLGEVKMMAKVTVNGKEVGGVWTAPWEVEITDALKPGLNTLEVSVVNTWVNRLIGDSKLAPELRKTWTSVNPFHPDSPLAVSGLKGPVSIYTVKF
jgi:hypothetical protein